MTNRDSPASGKFRTALGFQPSSRKISLNKHTSIFKLDTHLAITKAQMSRPFQAPPSDPLKVDHIIEEIESDMDVQRVGLYYSYEYLKTCIVSTTMSLAEDSNFITSWYVKD